MRSHRSPRGREAADVAWSGTAYFGRPRRLVSHEINGTLRQDIDRVASAIRVAKTELRYSSQNFAVFGPVWERNDLGHIIGAKYRVGDTYPAGYDAIWDRTVSKKLDFADAQGSAVAA